MKNTYLLLFIVLISLIAIKQCIRVKVAYIDYIEKSYFGQSLVREDYHLAVICYSNGGSEPADPQGSAFSFKMSYNSLDNPIVITKSPSNQENINYIREYYLPGLLSTNLTFSRVKQGGGTVKKFYVMYAITGQCESGQQVIYFRIKYFWCLSEARTFFENEDEELGSGLNSTLKIIHNAVNFEDTQKTINFGSSQFNLRDALITPTGTCSA